MDIYDDLGVRKIINGSATLTMLGGSLIPEPVLAAMQAAAGHFINLDELQEKAGQRIAEWTHNEAAYISSGAAAGLVLSTAACIAGTDPELRARLPQTAGLRNQIIVQRRGRVGYDFAIRQAGGQLVEIGSDEGATPAQLETAINEHTAGVFIFHRQMLMEGIIPLEEQVAIAHRHNIPVVIDAAAQIPPVANLWDLTGRGADLVLFSGGKGLRGPQSSGLILGRRDLIQACAFNACPRPFIGRPMKAGKEEIAGLLAALRWTLDQDEPALLRAYEAMVAEIIAAFATDARLRAARSFPSEAGQPMPRAEITLIDAPIARDELLRRLMAGTPAISLAEGGPNSILINPQTLQPGEAAVIVQQIKTILDGPAA